MTSEIKEVCGEFEVVTGMRVVVQERAGDLIKHIAKAEPLQRKGCGREDCFVSSTAKGGKCEKNRVGYRIVCLTCQMNGMSTIYEGKTVQNAFTRGMEHQG